MFEISSPFLVSNTPNGIKRKKEKKILSTIETF